MNSCILNKRVLNILKPKKTDANLKNWTKPTLKQTRFINTIIN